MMQSLDRDVPERGRVGDRRGAGAGAFVVELRAVYAGVRHLWLREARPRIRIIVRFAAVGTSDVFARLYGTTLQEGLGPNLKGQRRRAGAAHARRSPVSPAST